MKYDSIKCLVYLIENLSFNISLDYFYEDDEQDYVVSLSILKYLHEHDYIRKG